MEALDESPFSETPVDVVTFVTGENKLLTYAVRLILKKYCNAFTIIKITTIAIIIVVITVEVLSELIC